MSQEPLARNRDFKVLLVSQRISSLSDAVSFTTGSATIALMGIAVAAVSLVFVPVPALRRESMASR